MLYGSQECRVHCAGNIDRDNFTAEYPGSFRTVSFLEIEHVEHHSVAVSYGDRIYSRFLGREDVLK